MDALIQLNTTSWAFATRDMRRRVNHNIAAINGFDAGHGDFNALKFRWASRAIGQAFEVCDFAFGKQYIEKGFLDKIRRRNIQSSMAENCYQNAFAESFNDILKNHMLCDININSFVQLKGLEKFIKHCYNFNRNHGGIMNVTPIEFEQHILTLQKCQRTILNIKVIA